MSAENNILQAIQRGADEARKVADEQLDLGKPATGDATMVQQPDAAGAAVSYDTVAPDQNEGTALATRRRGTKRKPVVQSVGPSQPPQSVIDANVRAQAIAAADKKELYEEEKRRAFVESIPDQAVLVLTSPSGKQYHFRRDGDDFLVGKKGRTIGTEKFLKHIADGWGWKLGEKKKTPLEPAGADSKKDDKTVPRGEKKEAWAEKIQAVRSFEELFGVLMEMGEIKTSKGSLSANEVIEKINKVREAVRNGQHNEVAGVGEIEKIEELLRQHSITENYGLRKKTTELLLDELDMQLRNKTNPASPGVTAAATNQASVEKPESKREGLGFEITLETFQKMRDGNTRSFIIAEHASPATLTREEYNKYRLDVEGEKPILYDRRSVLARIGVGNWKLIADYDLVQPASATVAETIKAKEQATSNTDQSSSKNAPEQVNGIDGRIALLKKEVAEMRKQYALEDYESTNKWQKLRNFFRKDDLGKDASEKSDTSFYQAQYQNKLMSLQEAELEKIKQSEINGKELKDAMVGILRNYKYEEVVNLYADRLQVKVEHRGWRGKLLNVYEGIGRQYNKLSTGKKMAIFGAAMGTAAFTWGLSIGARGIIASAGTFVGMEALFKGTTEYFEKRSATQEAEKEMETLLSMENMSFDQGFEYWQKKLTESNHQLDEKLQAKKLRGVVQKLAAGGAAAAFFFGVPGGALEKIGGKEALQSIRGFVMDNIGGNEAIDFIKDKIGTLPREEIGKLTPDPGASGPGWPDADGNEVAKDGKLVQPGERPLTGEGNGNPVEGQPPSARAEQFLNIEETVKSGAGVDRMLMQHAESLGLIDPAQQTRFAVNLRHIIENKLSEMTSEELQAAGIPSGDTSIVNSGATIQWDMLLNPEEVDKAFADANGLSPEQIASITQNNEAIAEWVNEHPGVKLTDNLIDQEILKTKTEKVISQISEEGPGAEVASDGDAEQASVSDTEAGGDLSFELEARANDWYTQIFRMENEAPGYNALFEKEKLMKISVMEIFRDAKLLSEGSLSGYKTGLDQEQIRNFAQFFQGTKKVIGESIMEEIKKKPDMTVIECLRKMAPMIQPGQDIGRPFLTTH